jgi:hypothetical protein
VEEDALLAAIAEALRYVGPTHASGAAPPGFRGFVLRLADPATVHVAWQDGYQSSRPTLDSYRSFERESAARTTLRREGWASTLTSDGMLVRRAPVGPPPAHEGNGSSK